jgi:hypothetical protein
MRHDRIEAPHEQGREFRQVVGVAAFLDVFEVIQAQADDLAGSRHRQRICQPRERAPRRDGRACGEIGERLQIAPEHGAEIARQLGIDGLEVDDLIALDNAEPRPGLRCKPDNFHGPCPGERGYTLAQLAPPFCPIEQARARPPPPGSRTHSEAPNINVATALMAMTKKCMLQSARAAATLGQPVRPPRQKSR